MNELTFQEQILYYLNSQLLFEKEDIEARKNLSKEEKIERGILITDAEVIKSFNNIFILRVFEDNSKLRIGDSVMISFDSIDCVGEIFDLNINEIAVASNIDIPTNKPITLEVIESVFLQPMINLLEKIVGGEKPGRAFFDLLEGIRNPRLKGLGSIEPPKWDAFEHSFNIMQKKVIEDACLRPSVYCIQGPPGTGKTAVLSQIAYQFASIGKEVLVIANTHQAVNNALNKIIVNHSIANVIKIGNIAQASQLNSNIHINSNYNSYLSERKYRKVEKQADIVGMTLHAAIVNLGLRNSGFKPQIILVDEAGQIPMAYASLIGAFGCGSIVFIGDDKQMPPIFHPKLADSPFSTSIFKYLCDMYPQLRNTLNVTYRMNDVITSLISKCFYNKTQNTDVIVSSNFSALRRANFPSLNATIDPRINAIISNSESIVILNVTPSDAENTDSNIYEANFLAEISNFFSKNGISSKDYAIITPYRRQVKLIRSLIKNDNAPLINTVECLQGQDVETILISFVTSSKDYILEQLEFLLNPNRLNVMISRARTKIIILMSNSLKPFFLNRYPQFSDKFLF